MKKWIALLMGPVLALGFTACGGSSAPSQAESPVKEQEASAAEAPAAAPAESDVSERGKTLVVYFSATGSTEKAANYIAAAINGDVFKLEPENPYTDADLDWRDNNSRVVYEHDNPDARDVALTAVTVPDWEAYDTVLIGYPIWWGIAAWPVDSFVKANDFTGKTVIPFCTSSSSDLGGSGELLAELAGTGDWAEGTRFSSSVTEDTIRAWVESLGI